MKINFYEEDINISYSIFYVVKDRLDSVFIIKYINKLLHFCFVLCLACECEVLF